MNALDCLNRGKRAAFETWNLIAFFSVLCVASYLTEDWLLFFVGLGVELAYLFWASLFPYYQRRIERLEQRRAAPADLAEIEQLGGEALESQKRQQARSVKRRMEFYLDQLLLVVTLAGFVVILFFGFGKHLLSHRWPNLSH